MIKLWLSSILHQDTQTYPRLLSSCRAAITSHFSVHKNVSMRGMPLFHSSTRMFLSSKHYDDENKKQWIQNKFRTTALTKRHKSITSGVGVSTDDDHDPSVYLFDKRLNLKKVETYLLKVDEEIFEVKKSIKKCEEKIDQASESILTADGMMLKYWIKKEADLRKKEADLRKKETDLRKKEADLRKEKSDLMVLWTKEGGIAASTKPSDKIVIGRTGSYLSIFQRKKLATYHPEIIIGNLQEIVTIIELNVSKNNNFSPEGVKLAAHFPFICVVNPPRHGKSLLLDRLFMNRDDICVVEMTYTNLTKEEEYGKSSQLALYYFWLRFIHSVIPYDLPLFDLSVKVGSFNSSTTYNLSWAKSTLKDVFLMNPFENIDGTSKSLLIAVDEFSNLIDVAELWDRREKNLLIGSLRNEHRSDPFVRFVFTGFNRGITNLMQISGPAVKVLSLSLCEFSSARPLLHKIKEQYEKEEDINLKRTPFPLFLYEIVKSTPGLVGFWAERLFSDNIKDSSIDGFANMNWVSRITNADNLNNNWELVVRFLVCLEMNNKYDEEGIFCIQQVGEEMITNRIGVLSDVVEGAETVPVLSPFCMVLIVLKNSYKLNDVSLRGQLLTQLFAIIRTCDSWNEDPTNKSGESFVALALKIRILLRMIYNEEKLQQKQQQQQQIDGRIESSPQQMVLFNFYDLFPVSKDSTYISEMHGVDGKPFEIYIHGISNKYSLMKLLTSPLYYIFPVGTKALYVDNSVLPSTNITSWLASNYKLLENRKDFQVEISQLSCEIKSSFVNNTHGDDKFNSIEEAQFSSLIEPYKSQNNIDKVSNVWYNMQSTIDKFIKNGYENKISIFPMAEGADGCDLVMLLREIKVNSDDDDDGNDGNDNSEANLGVIHVVAIELKDRKATNETELQKKIGLLTSHRCILPRLRAALLDKGFTDVCYHIIFAGREHD